MSNSDEMQAKTIAPVKVEIAQPDERAAASGNPLAQFQLASMLDRMYSDPASRANAVHWMRAAARQKYEAAQYVLSTWLDGRGYPEAEPGELERLMEELAASDGELYLYRLAVYIYDGKSSRSSPTRAFALFNRAYEKGQLDALFYIARCHLTGYGTPLNHREAARWFEIGALKGDSQYQECLAFRYDKGEGVEQSYEKAAYWYRKASDQGLHTSTNNLGHYYRQGKGVEKDLARSVELFRRGADARHPDCHYSLGYAYEWGQGVEQDHAQARIHFERAQAGGNSNAPRGLARLDAAKS